MIVLADIEANGLKPTKIHVIVVKPIGQPKITFTDMRHFKTWVKSTEITKWVFHGGLTYDVPVINRLIKANLINPKDVIDTFVVSRLVNYMKFNTHSLDELGKYLGVYKGSYKGGWEECSREMIEYCEQDVEVLEAIFNHYKKYILDPSWSKAMRVEHDIATICSEMQETGFQFNKTEAEKILLEVKTEMDTLEKEFKSAFPPVLVEQTRIQVRKRRDGSLFKNVEEALLKYPSTYIDDDGLLVCLDYQEFNPASPKQRLDKLWDAGWAPTEKTDGYKKFLRESSTWKKS